MKKVASKRNSFVAKEKVRPALKKMTAIKRRAIAMFTALWCFFFQLLSLIESKKIKKVIGKKIAAEAVIILKSLVIPFG